ncbi:MAG: DNA-3-methyladenine glycosylase 2 family protein, partial [Candidatus Poseidoniia archaeon]|nr:DNA-3-methyladenine glycosylase 2 family protein [Candidatus Poseidoniia archaeon]
MSMLKQWDKAIEELAKNDNIMSNIISQYPKERMIMKNNTLHTLIRSIVGQQISVKAADAIWNRLDEACKFEISEENILDLSKIELRELGLSNTKADYIFNVVNANITKINWDILEDNEIIDKLCEIKGIGPWTAEMFLIFRLGRPNVLPLGDIGLINAINLHYNNKEKLSKPELVEFKDKWSPWCSVATWYMWRSL